MRGVLFIKKREGRAVEDVLIVVLDGMGVCVGERVSEGVDLVLERLLDVGVDAGAVVVVLSPVE